MALQQKSQLGANLMGGVGGGGACVELLENHTFR
jgi:hypothetical protein